MKVSSLHCACARTPLPLDHYSSGACPRPPMPLPRILGILANVAGDTVHRDGRITATRVLTCPRQVAIEDNIPAPFDVLSYNSIYDGVIEHAAMQRTAPPGTYTEIRLPPEGAEPPRLFGVPIEGTIDFVTADLREIHDYKKHSESAQAFKFESGGADPEVAAQMNIYRLMLAQCVPDAKVERLVVWHGAMTSANTKTFRTKQPVPPWFAVALPLMSEEEIAAMRPHGGEHTVQQIVDAYVRFETEKAEVLLPTDREVGVRGEPAEYNYPDDGRRLKAALKNIPLVGRGMWKGQKCQRYCAVKDICDDIEGLVRF